MAKIPDTFDTIFKAHTGKDLPLEFVKSLSFHESSLNPEAKPPKQLNSSALGLFQLLKRTVADFAKATGKPYKHAQMVRPVQATEVGTWHLRQIVHRLQKYAGLTPNWRDPQFVGLVTLAYVAGSEVEFGVPHLVPLTRKANLPVTVANVVATAMKTDKRKVYNTGAGYMSDPGLHRHVERIVSDYFALSKLPLPVPKTPGPEAKAPAVAKSPVKTPAKAPAVAKATTLPAKVQVFAKPGTPGAVAKAGAKVVATRKAPPKKAQKPGFISRMFGRKAGAVVNKGANAVKKGAGPVLKSPLAKAAGSAALDIVPGGGAIKAGAKAVNVVKQARNVQANTNKARNTPTRPTVQARAAMTVARPEAPKAKAPVKGPKAPGSVAVTQDEFRDYVSKLDTRVQALWKALPSIQATTDKAHAYRRGAESYVANWLAFRQQALQNTVTRSTVNAFNAFQKGYDTLISEGKEFLDRAENAAAVGLLLLGLGAGTATILFLRKR